MSDEVDEVDVAPESEVEESVGEIESGDIGGEPEAAAPAQPENHYAAFRNVPQFRGLDDRQIAARLYETMQREQAASRALQQYQQLVPVVSEYLPNREAFQKWREAQQQAPGPQPQQTQQPQQSQPGWWNPPQLKDSYRQYLVRDAEGREVIAEHAPLEAKAQLSEWMNYRADFARKFLDNPEQTLGPMVEQIASQRAADLVEKQITRQRQEQFVSRIEAENAEWLYSDPEKKIASREGVIVQKYIEDAKAMGIADPEARWEYSIARLERDLALQVVQQFSEQQQYQQQPPQEAPSPPAPQAAPAAQQAEKNMEFLRTQAKRTATRNSPATTDSRVPQRPMTFAERLKADLRAQGISNLE